MDKIKMLERLGPLAAAIALVTLSACGQAPVSSVPAADTGTSAQGRGTAKFGTGVGNSFYVSFSQDDTLKRLTMPLTYEDGKNYFASARFTGEEVNAYIQVKTRSGKTWEDRTLRLPPQVGNKQRFSGAALLPSGIALKDVASVELAFFCGKKWDSNAGKNYRIAL